MSSKTARKGAFNRLLWGTIAVLVLLVAGGSVAGMTQGPRITGVQSDPARATEASGSRLIMTVNQTLGKVRADQVKVSPKASFTVDASGRSIGVRFTQPLDDDTTYTVTVDNVANAAGGLSATLKTQLHTPAAPFYFLKRNASSGNDVIYRAKLDGADPEPVAQHQHIEDFRRSGNHLVISVVENDTGALLMTDLDGKNQQQIKLPGRGFVRGLQTSDLGNLVGYLFSDENAQAPGARESQLFLSSLRDPDKAPYAVSVDKAAVSVTEYHFVPDSTAILYIDFNGDLMLVDQSEGSKPVALGFALKIDGITRGTYSAVVVREKNPVRVDLKTGKDQPLNPPAFNGTVDEVVPLAGEDLLWPFTVRDARGMPLNRAFLLEEDGKARQLADVSIDDPVAQVCASPSGKYIAMTVTPGIVSNPYDEYRDPMPQRVQTRVLEVDSAKEVGRFDGFDISWCGKGPW